MSEWAEIFFAGAVVAAGCAIVGLLWRIEQLLQGLTYMTSRATGEVPKPIFQALGPDTPPGTVSMPEGLVEGRMRENAREPWEMEDS